MVALRMKGLPHRATLYQIEYFFRDFKLIPGSVVLGKNRFAMNNGFGVILFHEADQAEEAFFTLNKKYIGDRYI